MLIRDYFRLCSAWLYAGLLGAGLALVVYACLRMAAPDELTGGSRPGLWYGLLGYLCFVAVAVILAWHRWTASATSTSKEAMNQARPHVRLGLQVRSALLFVSRKLFQSSARSGGLRAHFWLTVVGVVLILCHTGFRWWSGLELLLMVFLLLTLLTGLVGALLQSLGPRWLRSRIGDDEIPMGQLPKRVELLKQDADAAFDQLLALGNADALESAYTKFRGHFAERYPYRLLRHDPFPAFAAELRKLVGDRVSDADPHLKAILEAWQRRRQYGKQQWLHWTMHVWIYAHVPVSIAMLALGAWHAVASVWF